MNDATAGSVTSEAIWRHLDNLTKPPRSLGRVEELAVRLCTIQQTLSPASSPRRLVVFAGDHGVVASGVTAWPSEVTGLMMRNIRAGGAASSVLARSTGTELVLVNVGAMNDGEGEGNRKRQRQGDCSLRDAQPDAKIQYRNRCLRGGTRNLAHGPAITVEEFDQAIEIGRNEARQADDAGVKIVAAGEIGIGNSTPAACLAMLLADVPLQQAVGRGAGADDDTLARKRQIVETAVSRARRQSDPVARMAEVAGFEIVAIAGFYIEAHHLGLTIVLDGYISGASALIAEHLSPSVVGSMIASHRSAEAGHAFVLERLGLSPYLDWEMRLGEGTGALVLMPLLDAAAAMVANMATFQELGILKEVQP